jgi:D-3-phosphoglycerate dehydrogenase
MVAKSMFVARVQRYPDLMDDGYVKGQFERAGFRFTDTYCRTDEEILPAVAGADGIMAMGPNFNRQTIEQLDRCRVIVQCSVGFNSIDVEACTDAGIIVANLAEFCVLEVRNHTLALLLAVNRKVLLGDRQVRAGAWNPRGMYPIQTLYGQTLGLLGFGNIARSVAPIAQALGMNVIASDPYLDPAIAAQYRIAFVGMEELLRTADYISCHIPLGPQTHHILGEAQFQMMKPTAYFINTSRGAVVDETALIKALQKGWIQGAGLDVLEKEPPAKDNPLFAMDNVILTPHSAGGASGAETMPRAWRHATEEMLRVLNGEWPRWFVNPVVKSRALRRQAGLR